MHKHLFDFAATLPRSPYNAPPRIVDPAAGVLAPTETRRSVALVGAGVGRGHAPLCDDGWEVWALNAVPVVDSAGRLRADRWFEMHERHAQSAADMRWITACEFPLYLPPAWARGVLARRSCQHERGDEQLATNPPTYSCRRCHAPLSKEGAPLHDPEDVPSAVAYPLAAVEARWGKYFTCTFAYQIALALHEGFGRIGLYGIELKYGTPRERSVEWACVSYWIGLCRGLGVTVDLPPATTLGTHPYRYGVEYDAEKAHVERWLAQAAKWDATQANPGIGG